MVEIIKHTKKLKHDVNKQIFAFTVIGDLEKSINIKKL